MNVYIYVHVLIGDHIITWYYIDRCKYVGRTSAPGTPKSMRRRMTPLWKLSLRRSVSPRNAPRAPRVRRAERNPKRPKRPKRPSRWHVVQLTPNVGSRMHQSDIRVEPTCGWAVSQTVGRSILHGSRSMCWGACEKISLLSWKLFWKQSFDWFLNHIEM